MHDRDRDLYENVRISVSGGSDRGGSRAARESVTVFSALMFDGARWMGIGGPHPGARACLCVVTWIGLMQQGVPLADLRERAEVAVRALEEGAVSVPVVDDRHRVDRVVLCPGRRPGPQEDDRAVAGVPALRLRLSEDRGPRCGCARVSP
jgi:hypothetical protein